MNKRLLGVVLMSAMLVVAVSGCGKKTKDVKTETDEMSEVKAQLSIIETKIDAVIEKQEMSIVEAVPVKTTQYKPAPVSSKELSVKDIQKGLKLAGFDPGVIDGKMGAKTKQALKDFQTSHGLKVDGIAGRETQKRLLDYL